jgi:isopenicillin-N epimerase
MTGRRFTPGGFHSLEHRWAAAQAFEFHEGIGRERVAERVHALARQCREGLARMRGVSLHTPMSDDLAAGIVAFEIRGMKSQDAMERLREQRIIATVAPYPSALLRFTPGIINTPDEVEQGLAAVRTLVRGG